MSDEKKKVTKKKARDRGLGRGLSALMADISVPSDEAEKKATAPLETKSMPSPETKADSSVTPDQGGRRAIQFISIARLTPNPDQPRKQFDRGALEELTKSVKEKGVLQPILVRPIPESARSRHQGSIADFQIVAGERRYQAAFKAGLDAMPVLIRDLSDQEVLEIGVVENVQRADLSPMEEARAYRALMDDFGRTQEDVSEAVGKSRPYIAQLVRFLDYPADIQHWIESGELSIGHGKAMFGVDNPLALAARVVDQNLSVRETEKLAKEIREGRPATPPKSKTYKHPDIIKAESDLADILGLSVDLRYDKGAGEIRIKYSNADQLQSLMRRLKR